MRLKRLPGDTADAVSRSVSNRFFISNEASRTCHLVGLVFFSDEIRFESVRGVTPELSLTHFPAAGRGIALAELPDFSVFFALSAARTEHVRFPRVLPGATAKKSAARHKTDRRHCK